MPLKLKTMIIIATCGALAILYFGEAFASGQIFFNEVAWMGGPDSAYDEWIELKNDSDAVAEIDGWTIKDEQGKLTVSLSGTIPAKGFYLLERTDDNSAPDAAADFIYQGALNNDGALLRLYNALGQVEDEISAQTGWPAGDNVTKKTMERVSGGWQTSQDVRGTPKKENGLSSDASGNNPILETTESVPSISPVESASAKINVGGELPTNVVINEILPSPQGSDETEEWVEIANFEPEDVSLAGWRLRDFFGKTKEYVFPQSASIKKHGFLVLTRPETGITLNNSKDRLMLLDAQGETRDEIAFQAAPVGLSLARFGHEFNWTEKLTPDEENVLINSPRVAGLTDTPKESSFSVGNSEQTGSKQPLPASPLNILSLGLLTAGIFSAILILVKVIVLN